MAASYPAAVKTFSAIVNGVTKLVAALFNSPYDEITAVETELGTDPAGSVADVKTRLAVALNDDGTLKTVAINKGGTGVTLVQRGRASLANGGTVTFPTSFGDTNYTLLITAESPGDAATSLRSKSATGFEVYSAGGTLVFNWLAIDDV